MPNSSIFKSNFLNNLNAVTLSDMCAAIGLAFIVGIFIYAIYRSTFKGVSYSSGFGFTLIALTAITTVLMLAVTSNVMLSLGMVGALSIVRFRTAIKDPMEIAFLFWSIEAGIVLAAGIFPLGIVGNAAIGVFFLVVSVVRNRRRRYLLVVRCKDWDNLDKAEEIAKKHANGHMALKGMTPHGAEGSSTDNDRNNDRNKDAGREMEADWEITFQDSGKKKDKNKGKRTQKQSRTNGQTAESGTPGEPKQSHSPERQLLQELQKLEGVSASLVGFNGSYAV